MLSSKKFYVWQPKKQKKTKTLPHRTLSRVLPRQFITLKCVHMAGLFIMRSAFLDFVDIFAGFTTINAITDASSVEFFFFFLLILQRCDRRKESGKISLNVVLRNETNVENARCDSNWTHHSNQCVADKPVIGRSDAAGLVRMQRYAPVKQN